jgi:hypothetical protein
MRAQLRAMVYVFVSFCSLVYFPAQACFSVQHDLKADLNNCQGVSCSWHARSLLPPRHSSSKALHHSTRTFGLLSRTVQRPDHQQSTHHIQYKALECASAVKALPVLPSVPPCTALHCTALHCTDLCTSKGTNPPNLCSLYSSGPPAVARRSCPALCYQGCACAGCSSSVPPDCS